MFRYKCIEAEKAEDRLIDALQEFKRLLSEDLLLNIVFPGGLVISGCEKDGKPAIRVWLPDRFNGLEHHLPTEIQGHPLCISRLTHEI